MKYALQNKLGNAQTFLEQDIEDFEEYSADSTAAKENLINTCQLYINAYSNAFESRSAITWGTSYFSEVPLGLLLKALPLVGMKAIDLFEIFTPRASRRWGYLNSNRIMLLATVVKACGFKEAEERYASLRNLLIP